MNPHECPSGTLGTQANRFLRADVRISYVHKVYYCPRQTKSAEVQSYPHQDKSQAKTITITDSRLSK